VQAQEQESVKVLRQDGGLEPRRSKDDYGAYLIAPGHALKRHRARVYVVVQLREHALGPLAHRLIAAKAMVKR
jgi:hypothetical protein